MLPINFHKTFVPERRFIGAILQYAAQGKQGTYQEISAETGIPMGQFSGKVPAILDYARGMGLVELEGTTPSQIKTPVLTAFGRAVYSHDKYLSVAMTQWLAHINLCRSDIGALAWRAAFAEGWRVLGNQFSRTEMENYLSSCFGEGRDRTGPLIRTYLDESALGRAKVLVSAGDLIERCKAPVVESYTIAYSAMILSLIEAYFPTQMQVTLTDFDRITLWYRVCVWGDDDIERLCDLLDRKGLITVDRQMRPWILEKRVMANSAWDRIYDDNG